MWATTDLIGLKNKIGIEDKIGLKCKIKSHFNR